MKDLAIAVPLAAIVLLKLPEVTMDTDLGPPFWHLAREWTLLLSAGGCVYLILDMRTRTRQWREMTQAFARRAQRLGALDDEPGGAC